MASDDFVIKGGEKFSENTIKKIQKGIDKGLIRAGQFGQSTAQKAVRQQRAIDTGRLVNSISYATIDRSAKPSNFVGSGIVDDRDLVKKPLKKNELIIGTNVYYAPMIENGSGPLRKGENEQTFDEAIRGWARRKGITDEGTIFIIKRAIRNRPSGSNPRPFIAPTASVLKRVIDRIVGKSIREEIDD